MDDADKQTKKTRSKVRNHWLQNGGVWVDMKCLYDCWATIDGWLNINALYPHLVSYGLATGSDAAYYLVGGNHSPSVVKSHLLNTVIGEAADYGPYIFFMCLLASGSTGHLSAAREIKETALNNNPATPPEISEEANLTERDGRGGEEQEEEGRSVHPLQESRRLEVAEAEDVVGGGNQSLVVPQGGGGGGEIEEGEEGGEGGSLQGRMEDLSLGSSVSSTYYSPMDSDVERDRPMGQPSLSSLPPSLTPLPSQASRRNPPILASPPTSSQASRNPPILASPPTSSQAPSASCEGDTSFNSLQSQRGYIAEENTPQSQSVAAIMSAHIKDKNYKAVVYLQYSTTSCGIHFLTEADCSSIDSFLSAVLQFITASLNSRLKCQNAILVAGIDEVTHKPYPLKIDPQTLSVKFPKCLNRYIFYRNDLEATEFRLTPEQAAQVNLTFLHPTDHSYHPTDHSYHPTDHSYQSSSSTAISAATASLVATTTATTTMVAKVTIAMVTVSACLQLCGGCVFSCRHTPTERGDVWGRVKGHSVKLTPNELGKLVAELTAHSNNCTP